MIGPSVGQTLPLLLPLLFAQLALNDNYCSSSSCGIVFDKEKVVWFWKQNIFDELSIQTHTHTHISQVDRENNLSR